MKWFRMVRSAGALLLGAVAFTGCLKNDIPYKKIYGNFTAFEVRGQTQPAAIDTVNRTVTVFLSDTVNPRKVYVTDVALTRRDTAVLTTRIDPLVEAGSMLDLSSPLTFTISTFQDYVWTVRADQGITRSFQVENQIGPEQIDLTNRSILVYVPKTVPLDQIRVLSAQFGPSDAVVTPDPLTVTDFRREQKFTVTYWGDVTEVWSVHILQTSQVVTTLTPDAWVKVAYLRGTGQSGQEHGFKYRKDGGEWITVDPSLVVSTGGSFTARITGLEPQQDYSVVAISGTDEGSEVSFRTQPLIPLENPSFDQWHLSGKIWNPWAEGGQPFWDTGNKGATTLGDSNTQPGDPAPGLTGHSARLESRFVGIAGLGKFAAGNLFAGKYVRTDGTNGILNFGQPYTSRPTRLKGKFNYTTGPIDYYSTSNPDFTAYKDKPDTCIVYIALIDGDPVEIRTKPSERKLFNPKDASVIAYAEMAAGASTGGWREFSIELDYRATNRVPTYIVLTCSASKNGDYFTGSSSSLLLIDEFELEFD